MSSYIVSARKYRPSKFEEVVGQDHVTRILKNALQTDHLAHAYLFTGPRGVGKTSCARILAKVVNCTNLNEDGTNCGTCNSCESFSSNSSFNIIELDGASNNGVDHIRTLNDQVRIPPQNGKYKVFIIDEVHMLSSGAFNAFLKTLEEPPAYAIFILATTEKHKILPTILSRCQVFDFRRIRVEDIVTQLQSICQAENINADEDALHIVAQKADGALRDALSLFDRLISLNAEKLTYDDVIENLSILDYDYYFSITDHLLAEDLNQSLILFNDIYTKGFEGDLFINGLADHFRNLLLIQDEATASLIELGDKLKTRYSEQAKLTSKDFLLTAMHLANQADIDYLKAKNKRLHIEMALSKMAYISRVSRIKKAESNPVVTEKKTIVETSNSIKETAPDTPAVKSPTLKQEAVQPVQEPAPAIQETPANIVVETAKNEKVEATPVVQVPIVKDVDENIDKMSKPSLGKSVFDLSDKDATEKESKADLGRGIPKITSLADIQSQTREAIKLEATQAIELTIEKAQKLWDDYANAVTSNYLKRTLNNCVLSVQDKRLKVSIGSQGELELLQIENEIIENFRRHFKANDIQWILEYDPELSDKEKLEKPKSLLSNKEKYEMMASKNPHLVSLKDQFDLKIDYD